MQRTALRAAADAGRSADKTEDTATIGWVESKAG